MLQGSFSYCGCAYDQRAVGDCIGDAGEGFRGGDYGGGVHGGAGCFEGHCVVVHYAQVTEAEVVHGSGYRTDVIWVAGAYQHNDDPVELLFRQHHV
jgi:hypothetical protein